MIAKGPYMVGTPLVYDVAGIIYKIPIAIK